MFATRTDSVVLTPLLGAGLCCLALAIAAPGCIEFFNKTSLKVAR